MKKIRDILPGDTIKLWFNQPGELFFKPKETDYVYDKECNSTDAPKDKK